jgi:hypothetical protein
MSTLELPTAHDTMSLLRADRISRLGNKYLGRLRLDQPMLERLGSSQIGLFADGFLSLDMMLGRVLPLADKPRETRTIVVYASKEAGNSIYNSLVSTGQCAPCRRMPESWQVGNLVFCSVEALRRLDMDDQPIDSVILLDPTCMIHRARTLRLGNGSIHDRPQIVASFLTDHFHRGPAPVLILMTLKRAAAVPTEAIARAFCLEAFWFLDGPTLQC